MENDYDKLREEQISSVVFYNKVFKVEIINIIIYASAILIRNYSKEKWILFYY